MSENTTQKKPRGRPKKDPEDKAQFKTISVRSEIYDQIAASAKVHGHTLSDEIAGMVKFISAILAPPPIEQEQVPPAKRFPEPNLSPIDDNLPDPGFDPTAAVRGIPVTREEDL